MDLRLGALGGTWRRLAIECLEGLVSFIGSEGSNPSLGTIYALDGERETESLGT